MSSMILGIDARYVRDRFPGIARYTYHLVRSLAELRSDSDLHALYNPTAASSDYVLGDLTHLGVRLDPISASPLSLREQLGLPLGLRGKRLDLLHIPYFLKPLWLPCPAIITVHDVIPLLAAAYLPQPTRRLFYKWALRVSVATARLVVVDSRASKADLQQHVSLPEAKIRVVYPGVEVSPQPHQASEEILSLQPYLLHVGTHKPHKNLPRLIGAFGKARIPHRLVLAGPEDPRFPEARQAAAQLPPEKQVVFLGRVGQSRLEDLYQHADFFVFPSLAEGFGLPALEAMAFGTPVIAARSGALPEVVSEAGVLVDPNDVQAWAKAMETLAEDRALHDALSAAAQARARCFTWQRTAEQMLAAYREASGS